MRQTIIFILLLSFSLGLSAQIVSNKQVNRSIDSLLGIIETGDKATQMKANYEIGYLLEDSLNTALAYYNKAENLAIELYDTNYLTLTKMGKAMAYAYQNMLNESFIELDSAIAIAKKYNHQHATLIKLYTNYGVVNYIAGNNIPALQYYLKAYEICQTNKSDKSYPVLVNNIGLVYKKLEQYEEAISFLKESVNIKRVSGNKFSLANSLFNIGITYTQMEYTDSAILYLSEAQSIFVELNEDTEAENINIVLANMYFSKKDYTKAQLLIEPFRNKPMASLSSLVKLDLIYVMAGLGVRKNNPREAFEWLDKLNDIERESIPLRPLRNLYLLKKEAFTAVKDYPNALLYADSVYFLEQKIAGEKNKLLTQELLAQLQTKEKETKIERLQTEKIITDQKLRISRRNNLYYIGGAILFAVVAIAFWLLSKKISRQKKLIEQNVEEQKKIVALNSMIEGQEAERLRVAKDLHDGLGGLLSTIKSHFSKIETKTGEEKNALINRTTELIDEACIEVRRISHNMVPHALTLSGIEGALEDMVHKLKAFNLNCTLEVTPLPKNFPDNKTAMLFRIVQELVQNIVKHAKATEMLIQLLQLNNSIHITVEDNGVGFNFKEIKNKEGLGINSIQSRVKYLNGHIQFDSVQEKGTTVNIEIPLP